MGNYSVKIYFRSRKIVKKAPPKPPTTMTSVPPPAPVSAPPLLPALSSPSELEAAVRHLHTADPLLFAVISSTKAPTSRPPPPFPHFHSLVRSILYQQLAPSVAAAIYDGFLLLLPSASAATAAADAVTPAAVLALAAADLRAIGVSGRKASYSHDLAGKFSAGDLSDSAARDLADFCCYGTLRC